VLACDTMELTSSSRSRAQQLRSYERRQRTSSVKLSPLRFWASAVPSAASPLRRRTPCKRCTYHRESALHDRPEIPEPVGCDDKEVFAFFGRCAYYSQVLEHGFLNLAVCLQTAGQSKLTGADILRAFEKREKATLGGLIREVGAQTAVPEALDEQVSAALDGRNYLAHNFFADHDVTFASATGRREMIKRLQELTHQFQTLDQEIDALWLPLCHALGLTQEVMDAFLAEETAKELARDRCD
jgi:hypothetical protein